MKGHFAMTEDELGLVLAPQSTPSAQTVATTKQALLASLKNAMPVPMPQVTPQQFQAMQLEVVKQRVKEGAQAAAGPVLMPGVPARMGATAATVSSSVRDTKLVQDRTAFPYSTCLKMRMSFGPSSFIGSAIIIGRRAVLTAGHCVYNHDLGGTWASNIQYIPRFNNGSAPDGVFVPTLTTCLQEYFNNGNLVFDIAASVVSSDFPDALGAAGYTPDHILPEGKLRGIGYPGQARPGFNFNGNQMWTSLGDYWDEGDSGRGTTNARNWGHYNDMTGGCSGGPIFTEGASPRLTGLNSHMILQFAGGPQEVPPRMYSPYFGQAGLRLVTWLRNNGGFPELDEADGAANGNAANAGGDLKTQLQQKVNELAALIGQLTS
jgi:V8-like Glu-specific endopeptidase